MTQVSNKTYDLEERTAKFAESIIELVKKIKITPLNRRIIEQVIGSSGSVGANYCEASEAESKKDFSHKINIARKELKEIKHWLRLLAKTDESYKSDIRGIWQENHELLLIFASINRSSRK
jgi:four helix bundle protein